MKLNQIEMISVGALIVYVAFFTHPPPRFVSAVLEHPVGQALVLSGILYVSLKKSLAVGLFLAIAYLTSSFPTLEYLDEKDQKPKKKEEEQPSSGAPKVDMKTVGKLASILAGPGGKLPTEKGKDVKEPPASQTKVKPHTDPKVTEKFSQF
jgi:hypothetical protein